MSYPRRKHEKRGKFFSIRKKVFHNFIETEGNHAYGRPALTPDAPMRLPGSSQKTFSLVCLDGSISDLTSIVARQDNIDVDRTVKIIVHITVVKWFYMLDNRNKWFFRRNAPVKVSRFHFFSK
ncbi:hypothetical protein SDC9_201056 [bioreactor metagenome]|uniref:Uncharacterized protein n=1 Tax=bioreactor metagenome TaxID=1076179 RepID=A0A645IR68_9ZZZZ